ncbi:MAG TPA: MoxR family ATPase [Acidimicrobiales bacterium]|nr:MoxR family ATPase [Acidimicrobiales bacterium]
MARQRTAAQNVTAFADRFDAIVDNIEQVIAGKQDAIRLAVVTMVAEGHLLIEDVPGVGKTSLAKALAASLDGAYHRIQFTPDLLPSDVTGVTVYNRNTSTFEFRHGGIFANVVLGDEINRASPKTQSALLEAMEERQVTVDTTTYHLDTPFMVIATQNPIEHEGTYPLPESQLDRFLMRIEMGYPDKAAEIEILDTHGAASRIEDVTPVATSGDIEAMIRIAQSIHVAPALKGYLVDLADATRRHPRLTLGVSPRGTLALMRASRALAASVGREFVLPDDIKALAAPVLEHRLMLTPEAQMGGVSQGDVLDEILASVAVPTARER